MKSMTEDLPDSEAGDSDCPFPETPDEEDKRIFAVVNQHPALKINRSFLRQLGLYTLGAEGFAYKALNLVLLGREEMRRYNRDFHNSDTSTDHLGFQFEAAEGFVSGDVFVCLDDCALQAPEFGNSFRREVAKVCIHGILHLCGWNDDRPAMRNKMSEREEVLLNAIPKASPLGQWLQGGTHV